MATKGTVSGVIANMVTLTVDGPVAQNEICYILTGGDRLMAEVIKVVGSNVYVQVFESTRGLKVGAEAEFTGHMLEVTLGPGMLSKNYDGLQNDLDKMDGVFLKRGQYTYPLDKERVWHFVPLVKVGDEVGPSAWLGRSRASCSVWDARDGAPCRRKCGMGKESSVRGQNSFREWDTDN